MGGWRGYARAALAAPRTEGVPCSSHLSLTRPTKAGGSPLPVPTGPTLESPEAQSRALRKGSRRRHPQAGAPRHPRCLRSIAGPIPAPAQAGRAGPGRPRMRRGQRGGMGDAMQSNPIQFLEVTMMCPPALASFRAAGRFFVSRLPAAKLLISIRCVSCSYNIVSSWGGGRGSFG